MPVGNGRTGVIPVISEHTITRENGGTRTTTTRTAFCDKRRWLGTEEVRVARYVSRDRGWTWEQTSSTVQFATREELSAWIDEMYRNDEIARVRENGGTRLIYVV